MSNYLTDGRLALMDALKGDAEIQSRVKTWVEFGPGLKRRSVLEPAACPALSVLPARLAPEPVANLERELPQTLRVEITTDGQDVAPCEELVSLVLQRVRAAGETCLGLADRGLTTLRVRSVEWRPLPRPEGSRLRWRATVRVELPWRRR